MHARLCSARRHTQIRGEGRKRRLFVLPLSKNTNRVSTRSKRLSLRRYHSHAGRNRAPRTTCYISHPIDARHLSASPLRLISPCAAQEYCYVLLVLIFWPLLVCIHCPSSELPDGMRELLILSGNSVYPTCDSPSLSSHPAPLHLLSSVLPPALFHPTDALFHALPPSRASSTGNALSRTREC